MEILIIVLMLIMIAINCYTIYNARQYNTKQTEKPKLSQKEKDKQKRLREAFDSLMSYDENIARSRK